MEVKLIKSFSGNYIVSYACPNCNEKLRNPISEAGQTDVCPTCRQTITVPINSEIRNMVAKLKAEEEEKTLAKEAEAKAKRAKAAEKAAEQAIKREAADKARQGSASYANPAYLSAATNGPSSNVGSTSNIGRAQYTNYHSTASRRQTEAENDDLVTWAVKTTRHCLKILLIVSWVICALYLIGGTIGLINILATDSPDPTQIAYLIGLFLALVLGTALGALSATISIGVIGVLFEIEENTRK